jgi:transglutaminase-like putative cysteine protease
VRRDTLKALRGIVLLAAIMLFALAAQSEAQDKKLPPGDRPPPDVFSRVEDAGTAADYDDAEYVIVYDEAVNRVKPSGVTYVDSYIIHKILTPAGVRNRSVLRWNYDPQSSYVEVREVNVIRDGKRIPVDVSKVHDLPAPQSWIYWKDRIKTLQLPRLRVNDGIEIKVFRKGFTYALLGGRPGAGGGTGAELAEGVTVGADTTVGAPDDERYIPPMPGEYFDIVIFPESAPIVEKRYVLNLPAGKRLHSEVYNGPLYSSTTYSENRTEYAWWGLDLPPRPHEPRQPDRSDFVAKVVMATAESWEAKSRWFFDVNRDQFEVTEAIKAKVDEIFDDMGVKSASEERKAEVLVHWVAQNIRYSGQTMGEGEGFTLHPGTMIFEQRSGVCKDIAGMLITMMRAAGMNSFGAMTMAGSRIDEVPADQFNHCVCALKKSDGSFEMYDPTWVPYNNSIWSLLEAEQHYLVGTPEGEKLSRIPYSPPEESPLHITHKAKLSSDGTLEGTFELRGSGAMDSRLRGIITYSRLQDMRLTFARLLSPVSNRVEGIEYEYHTPNDFSRDMWITFRYRIPRFAFSIDNGFEFRSPMMQVVLNNGRLFRAATTDWGEKRETDIFLYYTQLIEGTETIQLPGGYKLVDPVSSDEIDETYAYFKGDSRMKGSTLTITQRAEIRRRQIPPDGYGGFKRAIDEAKEWGEKSFRVEKGGK